MSIISLIISVTAITIAFIAIKKSSKKSNLFLTKEGKVYTIKDDTGQDIYKMRRL